MKFTTKNMDKKYSAIIILVTVAVVLNFIVLGVLTPQSTSQSSIGNTNSDKSISNVTASVLPAYLSPYATLIPSAASDNISNPSSNTDKLTITNVQRNLTAGSFLVSVYNHEPAQVGITDIFVDNCPATLKDYILIPANSSINLLITLKDGIGLVHTYQIRLLSSEGQSATYYEIVC
jgi:hypothetical protein